MQNTPQKQANGVKGNSRAQGGNNRGQNMQQRSNIKSQQNQQRQQKNQKQQKQQKQQQGQNQNKKGKGKKSKRGESVVLFKIGL